MKRQLLLLPLLLIALCCTAACLSIHSCSGERDRFTLNGGGVFIETVSNSVGDSFTQYGTMNTF